MTHTGVYVHIYLDSDVYLSLDGVVIPNHGYVVIDNISMSDEVTNPTPLLCHTNRSPPNGEPHSGGDWISPTNVVVGGLTTSTVPGFVRNRGPMEVRLWRATGTGPPVEGIYRCEVMDATDMVQTVYVGLYNDDGGGNVLYV